jgi:hypothetical protein
MPQVRVGYSFFAAKKANYSALKIELICIRCVLADDEFNMSKLLFISAKWSSKVGRKSEIKSHR